MTKDIAEAYGDRVKVTYIDTDQVGLMSFPLIARVVQLGYAFPIIAFNGQPRMAGGIDVSQVKKVLDEM